MLLKDVIIRLGWQARINAQGFLESGSVTLGETREIRPVGATNAWVKQAVLRAAGHTVTLHSSAGFLELSHDPVRQIESFSITAAAGATATGPCPVVVTGEGIAGSPLTVQVPLVQGVHTTQSLVAAIIIQTLANTPAITALWNVAALGPNQGILTRKANAANDGTLNIAIPGGRGVTARSTSTEEVLGVLGTDTSGRYALDALGEPLAPATEAIHFEIRITGGSATAAQAGGFGTVTLLDGMAIRASSLANIVFTWASGIPQIDIVFIGK